MMSSNQADVFDDNVQVDASQENLVDSEQLIEAEKTGCWKSWKEFPKSVFCIIGNEFCERFNYYGMKAVLLLYLLKLGFSNNQSTSVYHAFIVLAYFAPLLGSILADGYIGKFLTIVIISMVYLTGSVVLAISSSIKTDTFHPWMDLVGLGVIALGTGGIKPCVAPFGADQFKPGQEKFIQPYFSIFYASINAGSLLSSILSPIFRIQRCMGDSTCYPLSFGVPAGLMIVATVIFLLGSFSYRKLPRKENVIVEVIKAIRAQFIEDIKILFRILIMYLPVPIFWSLFDQQGSRWLLQTVAMDYRIGKITIPPEIIQILNPILILAFIPIFQGIIYPLFKKCGINPTLLRRMVVGGFFASAAFVVAGLVQLKVNKTLPVIPEGGEAQLSFVNTFNCNINFESNYGKGEIQREGSSKLMTFSLKVSRNITWNLRSNDTRECPHLPESVNTSVAPGKSYYSLLTDLPDAATFVSDLEKSKKGEGEFKMNINYFLYHKFINGTLFLCKREDEKCPCDPQNLFEFAAFKIEDNRTSSFKEIKPGTWFVYKPKKNETWDNQEKCNIHPDYMNVTFGVEGQGGIYSLTMYQLPNGTIIRNLHQIVADNSVSVLLQIPQYAIITAAEIMFSITGYEFSYSQASPSLKSVVQAAWLLTISVGDCLIILVTELELFDNLAYEMLTYAGLMFVFIVLYSFMCVFYYEYKYYDQAEEETEKITETEDL